MDWYGIDWDSISLDGLLDSQALLVLAENSGLAFKTQDGEQAYFRRAKQGRVVQGAALAHAMSVNPYSEGENGLFRTVTKMMAYEVRQVQERVGADVDEFVSFQEVERSKVFMRSFGLARLPKNTAMVRLMNARSKRRTPVRMLDEKQVWDLSVAPVYIAHELRPGCIDKLPVYKA